MVSDIRPRWRRWLNPRGTRRGAVSTAWCAVAVIAVVVVEVMGGVWVRPLDGTPQLVAWLLMSSWLFVGSRWV